MKIKLSGNERLSNALGFIVKYRVFFILAILCTGISIIQPVFFRPQNLINVLRQISSSAVLAIGFTIVLSTGNIDLSVGTLLGMTGIIMAKLSKIEGMSMFTVLAVGAIICIACGMLNAIVINVFNLPSFIVTLASMSIFKGICYIISNTTPVNNIAPYLIDVGRGHILPIPSIGFPGIPILIIIMSCVTVAMYLIINKTIFGRHAIAMGGNLEAAKVSGVNTNLVRTGVFVTMSLCAFIASVMITGRASSAQPVAGQGMEMDAIAAAVIGGTPMIGGDAKTVGTLFGCMIVGVINNGLNLLHVDSNFQLVVKGLLIMFAIILDAQSAKFFASKQIKKRTN
ncbi:MAG: ABC transporter permease [Treponema sp.]|nr:ABC transporter permease [Treponema sp.]